MSAVGVQCVQIDGAAAAFNRSRVSRELIESSARGAPRQSGIKCARGTAVLVHVRRAGSMSTSMQTARTLLCEWRASGAGAQRALQLQVATGECDAMRHTARETLGDFSPRAARRFRLSLFRTPRSPRSRLPIALPPGHSARQLQLRTHSPSAPQATGGVARRGGALLIVCLLGSLRCVAFQHSTPPHPHPHSH